MIQAMPTHHHIATNGPELFIGVVGAAGTDLPLLCQLISESLVNVGYATDDSIRLSQLIRGFKEFQDLPESPVDAYIREHQKAGNQLRQRTTYADILARLSVRALRGLVRGEKGKLTPRTAFLFRSLKRPEEVKLLRQVYRDHFVLVAAYTAREDRVKNLAIRIADDHFRSDFDQFRKEAEEIVTTDYHEETDEFGQDVRGTFHMADVFIDVTDRRTAKEEIDRFVNVMFQSPFFTPTKDEHAMFIAQAASRRSAALGRQVGAAVTNRNGDILTVGTNEVPNAFGGQYWTGDPHDGREYTRGTDSNDQAKNVMISELITKLHGAGWINDDKLSEDENSFDLLKRSAASDEISGLVDDTQMDNITEFGREVHAEMAAITNAARLGISLRHCTLYSTTFPCHNCTKHIIASGISRVVYIEPYPKSQAARLHDDALVLEPTAEYEDMVSFVPFVGLGTGRYMQWFAHGKRKRDDGSVSMPDMTRALPNVEDDSLYYLVGEEAIVSSTNTVLSDAGLAAADQEDDHADHPRMAQGNGSGSETEHE